MLKFSKSQWSEFDRHERTAAFETLRVRHMQSAPHVSDRDSLAIRDELEADTRGLPLHEASIEDLFFMSFDLGKPITRDTTFRELVETLRQRNFPLDEIINSVADKRRRDLELV